MAKSAPIIAFAAAVLIAALPGRAQAGPPYVTDDPEPVEKGHVEVNFFASGTTADGAATGFLPGADANFGVWDNVQLHIQPQAAYSGTGRSPLRQYGPGDTELGIKYRFLEETPSLPQVALYPLLEIPTGSSSRNLGTGTTREFIPLWIEKNWGPWQSFGGGGWWNNPGAQNRDYWFAGWVVQRKLAENFTLGWEIFGQTANRAPGASPGPGQSDKGSSGFNAGGTYDFNEHYHLLLSAGRGLQEADDVNRFSYYLALQVTY